jgi:hypothetical protein
MLLNCNQVLEACTHSKCPDRSEIIDVSSYRTIAVCHCVEMFTLRVSVYIYIYSQFQLSVYFHPMHKCCLGY